jgi:hypothetical protein
MRIAYIRVSTLDQNTDRQLAGMGKKLEGNPISRQVRLNEASQERSRIGWLDYNPPSPFRYTTSKSAGSRVILGPYRLIQINSL